MWLEKKLGMCAIKDDLLANMRPTINSLHANFQNRYESLEHFLILELLTHIPDTFCQSYEAYCINPLFEFVFKLTQKLPHHLGAQDYTTPPG